MDYTTFAKPDNKINNVEFKVQIVHLDGNSKGQIKCFSSKLITFGRNGKCDVVLKHAALTVSRIHAKIILKNDRFALESISPNGSFVNGQRIEKTCLYSGDIIRFSESGPKVEFLYEKIINPVTPHTTMEQLPNHSKPPVPSYREFRLDNNVEPRKNDVMRTYIVPAPEPSLFANLKSTFSTFRKKKRKK